MKKITFLVLLVALMVGVSASTNLVNRAVQAAVDCVTEVVTPEDTVANRSFTDTTPLPAGTRWVEYNRGTGTGDFVVGPGTPPEGIGSFKTVTPDGNAKVTLFNYEHTGTKLADINALGYATYRDTSSTATVNQVPAINIEIDRNGGTLETGDYAVLVFEPVYNTSQGPVVPGMWQQWDAYNDGEAIWWSSRAIPGVCAFSCFVTWDAILAANPDATIVGGFGVNQGGGNAGLIAYSDALKIGTADSCVTYDFEPYEVASSQEGCKNGGWKTLKRANGSTFKNQGDCIQYVNTGKQLIDEK